MVSIRLSRWTWLAAAGQLTCGTATAQDFVSGLSAYDSGDYSRAFGDWVGLAERGDARAEAGVGFLFHNGLGVARNDVAAVRWFAKADV
jgi:uncharacterized protein